MMGKLKAIWDLLRLDHGFMYALGVVIGIFISSKSIEAEKIILGILTAVFCQASAFALNDYVDYEVDKANMRLDRPLVRGDLKPRSALLLSIILAPFGFISSYLISLEAFISAFLVTFIGYMYDLKLKEFGIIGNTYIAFSMSFPFIFGGIIVGSIEPQIIVLSLMAFLSGLGREIMKDIEDVVGDGVRGVRSVVRIRGFEFAKRLSSLLFLLAVILSPIPFVYLDKYMFDMKYIIPIALADFIFIHTSIELLRTDRIDVIGVYRKRTLIAILIGLIGFLLGVF